MDGRGLLILKNSVFHTESQKNNLKLIMIFTFGTKKSVVLVVAGFVVVGLVVGWFVWFAAASLALNWA